MWRCKRANRETGKQVESKESRRRGVRADGDQHKRTAARKRCRCSDEMSRIDVKRCRENT